jgi:hypothetical protein
MTSYQSIPQNDTPPTLTTIPHFEFTTLLCKFALLIEKDGGIRPCDVLATCAYKVLRSTYPPQKWIGQISESQFLYPTFRHKPFSVCSVRLAVCSFYAVDFNSSLLAKKETKC